MIFVNSLPKNILNMKLKDLINDLSTDNCSEDDLKDEIKSKEIFKSIEFVL